MSALLKNKGIRISPTTCHKYMNCELKLFSVTRRHRPGYCKGAAHKVFENILKRQFTVPSPDKFWCTDFTYIPLSDGSMRYNCTIIDLYDRSVICRNSNWHKNAPFNALSEVDSFIRRYTIDRKRAFHQWLAQGDTP
jgi:putative transposase